jgi:hypothetical protein
VKKQKSNNERRGEDIIKDIKISVASIHIFKIKYQHKEIRENGKKEEEERKEMKA